MSSSLQLAHEEISKLRHEVSELREQLAAAQSERDQARREAAQTWRGRLLNIMDTREESLNRQAAESALTAEQEIRQQMRAALLLVVVDGRSSWSVMSAVNGALAFTPELEKGGA